MKVLEDICPCNLAKHGIVLASLTEMLTYTIQSQGTIAQLNQDFCGKGQIYICTNKQTLHNDICIFYTTGAVASSFSCSLSGAVQ